VAIFNVRLSDDLAARFDAAACGNGGRSALLRRLITEAAGQGESETSFSTRRPAKLTVRLAEADLAAVAAAAADLHMTPNAWAGALIARRVAERPAFGPAGQEALVSIAAELRRIGVNLNQMARALNAQAQDRTGTRPARLHDPLAVEVFRLEVRGHADALGRAIAGNLTYWDVAR
jgi:hypothetical protein